MKLARVSHQLGTVHGTQAGIGQEEMDIGQEVHHFQDGSAVIGREDAVPGVPQGPSECVQLLGRRLDR